MAINKKLIHFKLKSTFESELEAGNILDTSIVFIQDANLIWTHGTYYCLPKDEILISEGTEPTDGQEIWIDLSEDSTVFAVEEAPKDGKQYVRENGKWVEIFNHVYAPAIGTIFKDSDGANALEQNVGTDTSWIKGKRCLVKKTRNGVAICYLDENNSELFHDGTTAASLDGSMGQWMTDVPEYYFNVDESTSGIHALQVSQFQQGGWKQSRRVLVGVTEAVNVSNKLWSKKGGRSTGDLTPVVFHNYATALGSGFDIIDYETHCKIAHLFYTKYANRNPQGMSQFGQGENSHIRTIGTTSSLGNNDGKTSTQISFLGIEDFYGGKYEWMGGIHSNGSICYIYDGFEPDAVPTASYRTVDVGGSSRSGYISKVYWGEHGDMIPTEVSASSTTHYCDLGYVAYSGWCVALRSWFGGIDGGGVACCAVWLGSGGSAALVGSRIQYRGSIQVIEDPAKFKSLPVGF